MTTEYNFVILYSDTISTCQCTVTIIYIIMHSDISKWHWRLVCLYYLYPITIMGDLHGKQLCDKIGLEITVVVV